MSVRDFLADRPVFTYDDFAAYAASDEPRARKRHQWLLAKYTRSGKVLRVRRGLYATVPQGVDPEQCPVDPFLLAAKMTADAVLAYHTALEFHGKAHSAHQRFLYLTATASRSLEFRSFRFERVSFPRALREKDQEAFGVEVADRAGLDVRVTSLERTMVDVLDRPELGGGWTEVWQSLESVEFFDLDKVVEYALLLENATTAAKVGFYLEQHREVLMAEDTHLEPLRERRPKSPHYMVRGAKGRGQLVAHWNLVVPREIMEQSWREPR